MSHNTWNIPDGTEVFVPLADTSPGTTDEMGWRRVQKTYPDGRVSVSGLPDPVHPEDLIFRGTGAAAKETSPEVQCGFVMDEVALLLDALDFFEAKMEGGRAHMSTKAYRECLAALKARLSTIHPTWLDEQLSEDPGET